MNPADLPRPLRRRIVSETRVFDRDKGLVEYVASDQSLDSYREVILASGWKFNLFQRNAPFVDSHDYSSISKLLGHVVDCRVEGDQLIETVQWAHDVPENALARLGWKMTLSGHLRAVSVGFFPCRTFSPHDADPRPYEERVRQLGLAARPPARIYAEQEQIELSACLIGANPNALARAHRDGAVSDRDLAAAGIGGADAEFLHEAARLFAQAETASPTVIATGEAFAREFGRLLRNPSAATPFPDRNAPAPDSQRRRDAFLREFTSALNP